MGKVTQRLYAALVVGLVGIFLLAACGGASSAPPTSTAVEQADTPAEEADHEDDNEAEHVDEPGHDDEAEDGHTDEAAHDEEDSHAEEAEDEHGDESEDEHLDEAAHDDEDTHAEEAGDDHEDEHTAGAAHSVPEEASEVPNPIEADAASVEAGSAIFVASCATCHGETGEGDGPAAEGLEVKPADLHESHVQELSDGALFYIVSHGIPDTPMVAWEDVLSEEERWHVVNFLRTFK